MDETMIWIVSALVLLVAALFLIAYHDRKRVEKMFRLQVKINDLVSKRMDKTETNLKAQLNELHRTAVLMNKLSEMAHRHEWNESDDHYSGSDPVN